MTEKIYPAFPPEAITENSLKENTVESYVAFLDVIGFSNIINNGGVNLLNYLNALKDWDIITKHQSASVTANIHMRSISDSIIIWVQKDREYFKRLLNYVSVLQAAFFNYNIILRGGISSGEVCKVPNIDILLGKGIINAYELEKIASVPRVIIDPKIIFELSDNNADFCGSFGNYFTKKEGIQYFILRNGEPESSGIRYVNLDFSAVFLTLGFDNDAYNPYVTYEFLKKNIYTDIKNANKYHWIARQFDNSLNELIRRDEFNKLENKKLNKEFYQTLMHKFKGL